MAFTKSEVEALAPIVKFHPDEKYFPMDPVEFIRKSRFRHHRGLQSDQGYHRTKKKWVTSNSKAKSYYDIPIRVINAYRKWSNGENRRPRDPNCGDDWNVFLQPKGRLKGVSRPTGKVPAFFFQRHRDTTTIPAKDRRMLNIKAEKYDLVSYWWFNGYNDGPLSQNHQGDWEHVTLKLKKKKLVGVYFFAHGSTEGMVPTSRIKRTGGRVVVYCARGSHASYAAPGSYKLILGQKDEAKNGGYAWDISQNLMSLRTQPWRHYAGAWGEVGDFEFTTGPLGPWHKRNKA